jgi:hypothetical protein
MYRATIIRQRIAVPLICVLASGLAFTQQQRLYLDAGRGRPPFDITRHSIPIRQIYSGGPPRDGIPALNNPRFVSPSDARRFLDKSDRVLAIDYNGIAKAYPINILNWHEIVNDDFNGKRVLVTWCPLCLSGIAFDAQLRGRRLTFGVSGKLYKSNLLMYDRETGSLWSQMLGKAVTGPLTGASLRMVPVEDTTWGYWLTQHPNTLILSPKTGYSINYGLDRYAGYRDRGDPIFLDLQDRKTGNGRIRPMQRVLGVAIGGIQKAYPFSVLKKNPVRFSDQVGNHTVLIHFDRKSKTAWVTNASGDVLPSTTVFWFAWRAFYPKTRVFAGSH